MPEKINCGFEPVALITFVLNLFLGLSMGVGVVMGNALGSKDDDRIKYISFSKNFGKEAAMYAGFCNSTGDYTAVMDADMQDPPTLLKDMIKILEGGEYDIVSTLIQTRKGEPKIRSFFARAFYKIMGKISTLDMVDGARDFRLMKRDMVDAIVSMC